MIRNKKAQLSSFNIFTFIVFAILVILVFGGWIYMNGKLYDVFKQVGLENEKTANQTYSFPCLDDSSKTCTGSFHANMSQANELIWGKNLEAIQSLKMVAVVYILGLAVVIIVTGFLERKHPFLFFIYILIALLAVIFSPAISNAYENILQSGLYDGVLTGFTTANYLLLHLPAIVLIVSVLGAIGLFVNLVRPSGESIY